MRAARCWAVVGLLVLLGAVLRAAPVIPDASVQLVGGNTYRYSYDLSGVTLMVNQELLIVFDRFLFSALSAPVSPGLPQFDLVLLQPNNPVGADGGYSLVSLVNQPSMAGPFSVDATYTGQGAPPGGVTFEINQLNESGGFVNSVTPRLAGVPEPGTFSMLLLGSMAALAGAAQRSRR